MFLHLYVSITPLILHSTSFICCFVDILQHHSFALFYLLLWSIYFDPSNTLLSLTLVCATQPGDFSKMWPSMDYFLLSRHRPYNRKHLGEVSLLIFPKGFYVIFNSTESYFLNIQTSTLFTNYPHKSMTRLSVHRIIIDDPKGGNGGKCDHDHLEISPNWF